MIQYLTFLKHIFPFSILVFGIVLSTGTYPYNLPVIEYLGHLTTGVVCTVGAQRARTEGKRRPIRAFDLGKTSVAIECTGTFVLHTDGIFHVFLDGDWSIKLDLCDVIGAVLVAVCPLEEVDALPSVGRVVTTLTLLETEARQIQHIFHIS